MKQLRLILIALFASFFFYSCSDDFKVAAPYKNITLVYGLLNIDDTAHYIRIQKAFLDENKSAVVMAASADSSFYKTLDVVMKEIVSGVVTKTIPLVKVDANLEGYPKDTGTFFTSPNYAYKFKETLNPNNRYRLVITNPDLGFVDSAEIKLINSKDLAPLIGSNYNIDFSKMKNNKFAIYTRVPVDAKYIEAKITFRWVEKNVVAGTETDHAADFLLASMPITNNAFNIEKNNAELYSFIKESMRTAPANVERYIDSCDISFAVGGQELYDYIIVTNSQSGGLTGDQIKPTFTNIKGKDVYGLFSSRGTKFYKNIPISGATIDSMKVNPITSDLGIVGRATH